MANLIRYSSPLATRWPAFDDLFSTLLEPATTRWTEQAIRLDVSETPEAYIVRAEVPGVAKEQIEVNVHENDVSISTEFRQEKETNGNTLLSERVYGKASRAIRLPQPVDANAASAKHVDGVLQLTLPKKSVSNGARLTIN